MPIPPAKLVYVIFECLTSIVDKHTKFWHDDIDELVKKFSRNFDAMNFSCFPVQQVIIISNVMATFDENLSNSIFGPFFL